MPTIQHEVVQNYFSSHKRRIVLLAMLLTLNFAVYGLTNPVEGSVLVVILGYLVAIVNLAAVTYLTLGLAAEISPFVKHHKTRIFLSIWGLTSVCLALSSVGQLTWRDFLVVFTLGAIGYLYSLYFRVPISNKK